VRCGRERASRCGAPTGAVRRCGGALAVVHGEPSLRTDPGIDGTRVRCSCPGTMWSSPRTRRTHRLVPRMNLLPMRPVGCARAIADPTDPGRRRSRRGLGLSADNTPGYPASRPPHGVGKGANRSLRQWARGATARAPDPDCRRSTPGPVGRPAHPIRNRQVRASLMPRGPARRSAGLPSCTAPTLRTAAQDEVAGTAARPHRTAVPHRCTAPRYPFATAPHQPGAVR